MDRERARGTGPEGSGRHLAEPRLGRRPPETPTAILPTTDSYRSADVYGVADSYATTVRSQDPPTGSAMPSAVTPAPYPAPDPYPTGSQAVREAKKPPSTRKQIVLVTVPAVVAFAVGVWMGAVVGPSVFGGSTAEASAPAQTEPVDEDTPEVPESPEPEEEPEPEETADDPGPLGSPVTSVAGCAQGEFTWTSASIVGARYGTALVCTVIGDRPSVDYMVRPGAKTFKGTVGVEDTSAQTNSAYRFDVIDAATGRSLWHKNVRYGESEDFEVEIEGMLRIRLEVVQTAGRGTGNSTAVWANPRMS